MKMRLIIIAAAVVASVVAYDRLRPSKTRAPKEPQKIAAVAPIPTPQPAPASEPASLQRVDAPTPPPRPQYMTASEEAGFNAWVVKTYLSCWKPAAQPADSDPYVAFVRVAFKPDGSLSKARTRQSAVQSGVQSSGQERACRGAGLQPAAGPGPISPLL